jgi:hypothetical protein
MMSEKVKKPDTTQEHTEQVLAAVESVKTDSDPCKSKIIPVRVPERDYLKLRAFFAGRGLALATGARLAMYHVMSEIEKGTLKIDAGGVHK